MGISPDPALLGQSALRGQGQGSGRAIWTEALSRQQGSNSFLGVVSRTIFNSDIERQTVQLQCEQTTRIRVCGVCKPADSVPHIHLL